MKKVITIITLLCIVIISGCVQQSNIEPMDLGKLPTIDIEATIISLYLDELSGDCEEPEVCPMDRATVKIEDIDQSNDSDNMFNLSIGDEISINFIYSARPAKVRQDIQPTCREGEVLKEGSCYPEDVQEPYDNDTVVSSPTYNEVPAEMEGEYIVYHLPQREDEVTESILPGLEESNKIKFTVSSMNIYQQI